VANPVADASSEQWHMASAGHHTQNGSRSIGGGQKGSQVDKEEDGVVSQTAVSTLQQDLGPGCEDPSSSDSNAQAVAPTAAASRSIDPGQGTGALLLTQGEGASLEGATVIQGGAPEGAGSPAEPSDQLQRSMSQQQPSSITAEAGAPAEAGREMTMDSGQHSNQAFAPGKATPSRRKIASAASQRHSSGADDSTCCVCYAAPRQVRESGICMERLAVVRLRLDTSAVCLPPPNARCFCSLLSVVTPLHLCTCAALRLNRHSIPL
jgi:hypothetical protein